MLTTCGAAVAQHVHAPHGETTSEHQEHAAGTDEPSAEPAHAEHDESSADDSGPDAQAPGDGQEPAPYLRPPTAEERAQAFPDLGAVHAMHENPLTSFVLFDRLEAGRARGQGGDDDASTADWDVEAWVGRSLRRLWIRSEGERRAGRTEDADLELLYGRAFSPWWDYVAGVRHDFRPGPEETWAAFGVHGLAPYRFEIDATAYLGEGGQAAARIETEYELLMTNRWVLQPRVELDWYADDAPSRGIGAGLASAEVGLRLRYEIRREIAPYIGITRASKHGRTADFARAAGEDPHETRVVAGIRLWF